MKVQVTASWFHLDLDDGAFRMWTGYGRLPLTVPGLDGGAEQTYYGGGHLIEVPSVVREPGRQSIVAEFVLSGISSSVFDTEDVSAEDIFDRAVVCGEVVFDKDGAPAYVDRALTGVARRLNISGGGGDEPTRTLRLTVEQGLLDGRRTGLPKRNHAKQLADYPGDYALIGLNKNRGAKFKHY